MTGNELYHSVMHLGYARSLDDLEGLFYEAANLAIRRICRQFPIERYKTVTVPKTAGYYTPLSGKKLDPCFLHFCALPLFENGVPLSSGRDYILRGGDILIPSEKADRELLLCYVVSPRRLTEDCLEEEISCREDAEHLVPLLTATILWAQDDEELSNRYHALFRNAQTELAISRAPMHFSGYRVVGGWDR